MSKKIPCEMIQDLLPSYIDELTSTVTNEEIKNHMRDCNRCQAVLKSMKDPSSEPESEEQIREIDFLKKTRKRVKRTVGLSILCAVLLICVILGARMYLVPARMNSDYVSCSLNVEGRDLTVSAIATDAKMAISNINIFEVDGVVTIEFDGVHKSALHHGTVKKEFTASSEIREIVLNDHIVWSEGVSISPMTAAVYESRHLYVGDMSANGETARALNMVNYLGGFTSELQTSEEPYGMKLISRHSYSDLSMESRETLMRGYACVLMAVIDNLGEVTFEYGENGETKQLQMDVAKADQYAGMSVKEAGSDIRKLQQLMDRTGLNTLGFSSEQSTADEVVYLDIANFTDIPLQSIGISCVVNGETKSTQTVINADESPLGQNEILKFEFLPQDFGMDALSGKLSDEQDVAFRAVVTDTDGIEYTVSDALVIAPEQGNTYRINLSGNKTDGFRMEQ